MKEKQEMENRSVYLPKTYWQAIDDEAERDDLSANRVLGNYI